MSLQVWLPLNRANLTQQGLSQARATMTGSPVLNGSGGKLGYCIGFNSDGNNLVLPASAMNTFKAEDGCSVCFWLKINSWYSSYMTFFQAGTGSTPWNNYIFGFLRNGTNSTVCFTIGDGTTASNANYLTSELELSKWYHVALTYETGKCKIYLNGTLDHEYTTSIVPDFSKITKITIGRCNSEAHYQTNCSMNDFRIYNHTLSADEVSEISKGLMVHWLLENNGNRQIDVPRNLQPFHSVQIEYKAYSLGAPMPVTDSDRLLISFDRDMIIKTGSSNGTEGYGYANIYNSNNLGPHQISSATIFHGRSFASGDIIHEHRSVICTPTARSSPNRFDDVFEFYSDYSSENGHAISNLKVIKLTPLTGATIETSPYENTRTGEVYPSVSLGTTDAGGAISISLSTIKDLLLNIPSLKCVINDVETILFSTVTTTEALSGDVFFQEYNQNNTHYYIATQRYVYPDPDLIRLNVYTNAEVIWDSTKDNIEADCSGMGFHGTKMGVFSYSKDTPMWHASTYFKDYNSTIYCDLPGHIPTEYTMSCWIKSSNKNPAGTWHEPGNVNGQCYEFAIKNDGRFRSGCVIGGTRYVDDIANTNVLDGEWHMLTHTYNNSASIEVTETPMTTGVFFSEYEIQGDVGSGTITVIADAPAATGTQNRSTSTFTYGVADSIEHTLTSGTATLKQTIHYDGNITISAQVSAQTISRICQVTYTTSGSALKSYVDGELVDTKKYAGALTSMTKVGIGNYLPMPTSYIPNTTYGNTELYESDFRLYMTALSQADITKLYNKEL